MAKATQCPIGRTKVIIGRLHRCEYYLGALGKFSFDWSRVQALIITGEYFYKKLQERPGGHLNKMIFQPYGVNEKRYTFRDRKKSFPSSYNVAWLAKSFDYRKAPIQGISCFKALSDKYESEHEEWRFYMAAGRSERGIDFYRKYLLDRRPELTEKITMYRWQDDVNSWLEPMDVFLNTSINESFCFVIAEACLKGIKPLIWDFESADHVWPKEWLFFTDNEMFNIMGKPYRSKEYRDFIIDNYSLQKQIKAFDKIMKG